MLIRTSFKDGRGYYGSPRVQDDLVEWGERISRKRTIRLMQEDGLKARVRKRHKVTTDSDHDQPIAGNDRPPEADFLERAEPDHFRPQQVIF